MSGSVRLPESLGRLPRHQAFVEKLLADLRGDSRFEALLLGGSAASDTMDEFSDLDFVLVVAPAEYDQVMAERMQIAGRQGDLLAAFTGEHVGEPRLIVCLYGPQLLHVDLKFVVAADLTLRMEDPLVLWDRTGAATRVISLAPSSYPQPDAQWIEDRFWVLIHYAASRAERGEVLEAAAALAFVATRFIGPLILLRAGAQPNGVRRVEEVAPDWAERVNDLLPGPTSASCLASLDAAVQIYLDLRGADAEPRSEAETAVREYLREARAAMTDPPESDRGWVGRHSERLHRRRGRRP